MRVNPLSFNKSSANSLPALEKSKSVFTDWEEYICYMASLGYFPAMFSEDLQCVSPVTRLFEIYKNPIKYFCNLQFICEWHNRYRMYKPLCVDSGQNDEVFIGVDSSDYLKFVFVSPELNAFSGVSIDSALSLSKVAGDLYLLCNEPDEEVVDVTGIFRFINPSWVKLRSSVVVGTAPDTKSDKYLLELTDVHPLTGEPFYVAGNGGMPHASPGL